MMVLRFSRILFVLGVLGYYTGTLTALLVAPAAAAFLDPQSFNYPLIAMAVGGIFLVPSLQTCLLALVAVALSPRLPEY